MSKCIPKQHSIWAPVGPQLGQVGPQLGPTGAQLGICLSIWEGDGPLGVTVKWYNNKG